MSHDTIWYPILYTQSYFYLRDGMKKNIILRRWRGAAPPPPARRIHRMLLDRWSLRAGAAGAALAG